MSQEKASTSFHTALHSFHGTIRLIWLRNSFFFVRTCANSSLNAEILNEFGQSGNDGTLLSDLDAMTWEISGGSVFCACCMDQFEAALAQRREEETILVEAFRLSDPTGVRRLFAQTDRFSHIQYMGAVKRHARIPAAGHKKTLDFLHQNG